VIISSLELLLLLSQEPDALKDRLAR